MSSGGVWYRKKLMVDHWAGKLNFAFICCYIFLTVEFGNVLILDECKCMRNINWSLVHWRLETLLEVYFKDRKSACDKSGNIHEMAENALI